MGSTVEDWARSFFEYLHETNYNSSKTLKMHNIHNIYNLLFAHDNLPSRNGVNGHPPDVTQVTDTMLKLQLMKQEADSSVVIAAVK